MRKLFNGLGALAGILAPVVAVVSCGSTTAKTEPTETAATTQTGTTGTTTDPKPVVETPVVLTPAQKFDTALKQVIAYLKTPEGAQAQIVHINLGLLHGINK